MTAFSWYVVTSLLFRYVGRWYHLPLKKDAKRGCPFCTCMQFFNKIGCVPFPVTSPAPLVLNWAHDDVIKWKHFPRYWPFVRGIHRSPVNSPYKGQWCGALMFSFICAWINGWANIREAGDLRPHRAHYDIIVMFLCILILARSFVSSFIHIRSIFPNKFPSHTQHTRLLFPSKSSFKSHIVNDFSQKVLLPNSPMKTLFRLIPSFVLRCIDRWQHKDNIVPATVGHVQVMPLMLYTICFSLKKYTIQSKWMDSIDSAISYFRRVHPKSIQIEESMC